MQRETLQKCWREPEANPLRTLAESRKVSFDGVGDHHSKLLAAVFEKAEVGLCGYTTQISVEGKLEQEIQVCPTKITLSERVFRHPALLQLHLRHAIELTLWLQLCGERLSRSDSVSAAILAAFTTTKFYLQMPRGEREAISGFLPDWLNESAESAEMLSDKNVLEIIAQRLNELMPLQSASFDSSLPAEEALGVALEYSAVANPTELILTQQGDERLLIDPATGLNRYGCSPRPRPDAITFSSCTASSVSEFAYRSAELLRHGLMQTLPDRSLRNRYESEMELVRTGLGELLETGPETEIILSSSGTDAELYPLFFLRSPGERLANLVVAPDEVGTGTVLAAGGRHFSSHSPLGVALRNGEGIDGLDAENIEVGCVPIRQPNGSRLSAMELKQHIHSAVTHAAKSADKVILHIVDNTKTGVVGPDVDFVESLQATFGEKLQVVVDACQFRLEKSNLRRYLERGFCVLITGSKFFTGPPFCGALFVPRKWTEARKDALFPKGFADYFTRSEVPRSLRSQANGLATPLNLGLLFRWAGALTEMRFFYSVPSSRRTEILQTFRNSLLNSIAANPDLQLLECPEPHRWANGDFSLWDAQPTIFSFAVRDPKQSARGWMGIRDLKRIYVLLNRDCSALLPESASEAEHRLAKQKCHIGQPVVISGNGERGALRIACGARLVYGISYDRSFGNSPEERFARESGDARTVLAKVSLLVKYWENFCSTGNS